MAWDKRRDGDPATDQLTVSALTDFDHHASNLVPQDNGIVIGCPVQGTGRVGGADTHSVRPDPRPAWRHIRIWNILPAYVAGGLNNYGFHDGLP